MNDRLFDLMFIKYYENCCFVYVSWWLKFVYGLLGVFILYVYFIVVEKYIDVVMKMNDVLKLIILIIEVLLKLKDICIKLNVFFVYYLEIMLNVMWFII